MLSHSAGTILVSPWGQGWRLFRSVSVSSNSCGVQTPTPAPESAPWWRLCAPSWACCSFLTYTSHPGTLQWKAEHFPYSWVSKVGGGGSRKNSEEIDWRDLIRFHNFISPSGTKWLFFSLTPDYWQIKASCHAKSFQRIHAWLNTYTHTLYFKHYLWHVLALYSSEYLRFLHYKTEKWCFCYDVLFVMQYEW